MNQFIIKLKTMIIFFLLSIREAKNNFLLFIIFMLTTSKTNLKINFEYLQLLGISAMTYWLVDHDCLRNQLMFHCLYSESRKKIKNY